MEGYVFIGDQGRVFSSFDEPTADDFDYAAVEMLTIVSSATCATSAANAAGCR